jgi:hypothetical protein
VVKFGLDIATKQGSLKLMILLPQHPMCTMPSLGLPLFDINDKTQNIQEAHLEYNRIFKLCKKGSTTHQQKTTEVPNS